MLHNCILRKIDVNVKKSQRRESIDFAKGWLADDVRIDVNTRYIINQVHFNFIPDLPPNPLIDNYLIELMCGNEARILALLQLIGYCCSTSVEMQQSVIWYGKGSNGKSKLAQILISLIGNYL